MFVITASVAVVSAIAVIFRPRDLRNEIAKVAKMSQTFQKDELVGDYGMPNERLRINSDGTYCLNLDAECAFGCDFVERGTWLLDRNMLFFQVRPSPTDSGAPLKWAFATTQDGEVSLIRDIFASAFLDRGYRNRLSLRPSVAQSSKKSEDQATD